VIAFKGDDSEMASLIKPPADAELRPSGSAGLLRWAEYRPAQALLLTMLVALMLGLVHLWLHPPSPQFNWENRWWQIAVHVARGEGYVACKTIYFPFCGPDNQVTAMREPLPTLLFAIVARVTNESLVAAAAAGVFINLGVMIAIFLLTRELANSRTGVLAALLWMLYLPPIRVLYAQVSGDLLAALSITCGLLYFVRARRTNRYSLWLTAGVWLGLAIMSRSAALVIALALTVSQIIGSPASRARGSSALRPVALFVLAWGLVSTPWLIRNYSAFDRPVIGSTLSGYYLYRQNHQLASDNYLRFVSGGEFVPVIKEMIRSRTDLSGTENEAAMDMVYREEALRVIQRHPLRYLKLSAYRFLMLWFDWGVKQVYRQQPTTGDYATMLQHGLLLAGGAIGLCLRWRRGWPLGLSVAVFSLVYMAVMAQMLYIVAVMPLLVALSAIACAEMWARAQVRQRAV
jgi:4-amino-4-deoxy-L-arabinose transferase-like glycosyltransferase